MKSRVVRGSIPLSCTILYRCGGIGIRAGFKNQWEFSLEGSSPSSGTNLSGCRRIGIANGFKPRVFGRGGSTPLTRTNYKGKTLKAKIEISIECGEKTCAYEKGKFCHLFRGHLGGKDSCYLFGHLYDKDGWVQRHANCLKMAVVSE